MKDNASDFTEPDKKDTEYQIQKRFDKITHVMPGTEWDSIQTAQMWDDYLAWCKKQENSAHE
jgi:hypothetical protein